MFLQKIHRLASDWDRSPQVLDAVARESLLYGMRLVRHPSALKKELKKVKICSRIAKPLWSGNAYLLHTLPEVMCNKKQKIPCLEDFLFARKVLSREHLKELRIRRKNRCKIPRQELFDGVLTNIKRGAWKGRFLPKFDAMYENLSDVEQDLVVRALEVMNKEVTNFKTKSKEEVVNYLGYCVNKKVATYLKQAAPKAIKARVEAEDFDRVVHQARAEENSHSQLEEAEFRNDLKKVVPPKVYRGIALLMQFADAADTRQFKNYLKERSLNRSTLTHVQLKAHIEKYLECSIFNKAMENQALREFLMNRQGGREDAAHSGYAECEGF